MTFVSGSHRMGDLSGSLISDASDAEFAAFIADRDLPTHTYGALSAGDATFHAGWTIHSAGPNPTERMRAVMTVIYVADGARVRADLTEAQDIDRRLWLGGAGSGDLIDSVRNPRLAGSSPQSIDGVTRRRMNQSR
jgi:ectoine hydroxylase-related dioxygenase (phytanoyl-CoA dioxygenase family)